MNSEKNLISLFSELKSAWLEQYGKSVQSVWEAFCGDDVVEINDYERDLIQAGAASREPEIQALREEVERLKAEADPEGLAIAHEVGYQRNRTQLLAAQLSERKLREKFEDHCWDDACGQLIHARCRVCGGSTKDGHKDGCILSTPTNTDEADKLIKALEVAKGALELATTFKWPYLNEMRQAIATINELGLTK